MSKGNKSHGADDGVRFRNPTLEGSYVTNYTTSACVFTSHVVCILLTKRLSKDSKGFEPFSLFFQKKSNNVAVRDYKKKVVVISYK